MNYTRSASTASTYGTIPPLDPTRLSSDPSMYSSQPLYGQMPAYSQNPYGYDDRTSSRSSSAMGHHSRHGSSSIPSAYTPAHRVSTPGLPSGDYYAQQMQNTHPHAMGMAAPQADQQYLAEEAPSTLVRPEVGTARTTEVAMERRYPETAVRYQCPYCPKNFTKRHNQEGERSNFVYFQHTITHWRSDTGHINSHFGLTPYTCEYCNKGFARSYDMKYITYYYTFPSANQRLSQTSPERSLSSTTCGNSLNKST
jgi:hypothetical protein